MNRSRELCCATGVTSRRQFTVQICLGVAGLAVTNLRRPVPHDDRSVLTLARNEDRKVALRTATSLLGKMDFGGKDLYLKGNYNSADLFPATTHEDTLREVISYLRESNCGDIILVERSGMGLTRDVWERLGVVDLAKQLGFRLLALEDLTPDQWRKEDLPGSGWKSGIEVPVFLDRDTYLVQICNLKTHRFGGVFSASLKNSIGLTAKEGTVNAGYNYMRELHASAQQGALIAEVNLTYQPKLIIMDAMQVFVRGGPEAGEIARPEAFFASSDRVAIDAAGVALLRLQRETSGQPVSSRTVYEHEQIRRACELNLGATNASQIRFLTADVRGALLASQLETLLKETPAPKK